MVPLESSSSSIHSFARAVYHFFLSFFKVFSYDPKTLIPFFLCDQPLLVKGVPNSRIPTEIDPLQTTKNIILYKQRNHQEDESSTTSSKSPANATFLLSFNKKSCQEGDLTSFHWDHQQIVQLQKDVTKDLNYKFIQI